MSFGPLIDVDHCIQGSQTEATINSPGVRCVVAAATNYDSQVNNGTVDRMCIDFRDSCCQLRIII
jgi:hypothetical protein